jgi:glucokinase
MKLRMRKNCLLAFDIGGSSVKYSVAHIAGGQADAIQVEDHLVATVEGNEASALAELVVDVVKSHKQCAAVGIATSGSVSLDGTVVRSGFFHGYDGFVWEEVLKDAGLSLPVSVLNDGQAAALAEFSVRPNNQWMNAVHFVVGTGVGGGLVVGAELYRGETGFAGALGHIKVSEGASALPCTCGGTGCVQTLASATAVIRKLEARRQFVGAELSLDRVDAIRLAESLSGEEMADLRASMQEAGYWLGRSIGSVINTLNPAYVTIGGGLLEADMSLADSSCPDGPYFSAAFRESQKASMLRLWDQVLVTRGRLGNDAGVRGAAISAAQLLAA